jgi:peroxiredoxin
LLKTGPVVLTFYRGDWCPFCNFTLRAYQAVLPEITELSGSLVAVSLQNADHTLLTVEHKELMYPVLSDVGNQVARQYTPIWTVPEAERSPSLQPFYDDDSWELPAPGTFVIAQDGTVKLAFVDADYTQRLEPAAVLDALRQLA